MSNLKEKIKYELSWREGEIATLKMLPFHSNISFKEKGILMKHSIPALYSLWEGFVKDAFSHYIDEINALKITLDEITPALLTHAFDTHYICNQNYLSEIPKDFQKSIGRIIKFFDDFKQDIDGNIVVIPKSLPTESNINYEVINKILIRFNLEVLPKNTFIDRSKDINLEGCLNKLLNYRNKVAHGDYRNPVEQKDVEELGAIVDEFSQLVIVLMGELLITIDKGYSNRTYIKNSS